MSLENEIFEKIINFQYGATGLLKIFPDKKEFTITFILGQNYCTPKAHKYEIEEIEEIEKNIKIKLDIPDFSILSYSAVDSLGYNYGNLDLFRENLKNEIRNLYIENRII